MQRWRAWLASLLILALITMGCGTAPHRPFEDGSSRIAHGAPAGDGVHKTHGGGAEPAFIALGCILIVFTFVIDVIILPCTIPNDYPFCCTREVVTVCFH